MSFPTPDQCIDLIENNLKDKILRSLSEPSILVYQATNIWMGALWVGNKSLYARLLSIIDELRQAGWVVHLSKKGGGTINVGRRGFVSFKDTNDFESTPSVLKQDESTEIVPAGYLRDTIIIDGETYTIETGYSIEHIRAALISNHPNLEKMNCLCTHREDGTRVLHFTSNT